MSISKYQASDFLTPYLKAFQASADYAQKEFWGKGLRKYRPIMRGRTQASLLFDLMIQGFYNEFDGKKGAYIHENKGIVSLDFDSGLSVRCKKVNKKNLPSYIPTTQSLAYFGQLEIPGLPTSERIIFGYRLNKAKTGFEILNFVYLNGKQVIWELPLSTATKENVVDIPANQEMIEQELITTDERIAVVAEIDHEQTTE